MQRSANSQIGTSQFGDEEGWAEMVWACEWQNAIDWVSCCTTVQLQGIK